MSSEDIANSAIPPSLEALRKEGRVGRTKLAGILRRLANVAREIEDVEDGEAVSKSPSHKGLRTVLRRDLQTRDAIDKYCEKFETDMLKHFDRYYQRGDPTMMAVSQGKLRRSDDLC